MYAKKRVCSQKNMCRGIPGLRINTVFNTKDKKLIKREKLYKGIKLLIETQLYQKLLFHYERVYHIL